MKVVVIGGVAGGPSFATRLRRLNETAEITLFERGAHISFASCALPYYLGDVITDRESLIERTPAELKQKNNIDVQVETEVTAINPAAKSVTVRALASGETRTVPYDALILATGARPSLPDVTGLAESTIAFPLRSMTDGDRIHDFIEANQPQSVTILGAGPAGIELAENMRHRGLAVTLVDSGPHVMSTLDAELAEILQTELTAHDVTLRLNTTLRAIDGHNLTYSDGSTASTDMVLVVTGVQPNNELAAAAGITVTEDGHIPVDAKLRTNVPDVYAIGDVIETTSRITHQRIPSVLSSAANRQGHLLADIVNGADLEYPGFVGVSVAQVFDQTVSIAGYTENALQAAGITDYDSILITPFDHAFFYPNAQRLNVKLLFNKQTGQLLGGEFVGHEGVDKRAGELSVALAAGMTIHDLPDLEFPYSPPYAASRDILNVAGYVAINRQTQLAGQVAYADLDASAREAGFFLDIREAGKPVTSSIPATANIPLTELRDRLGELPSDRPIYILDRKGLAPYNATRILAGNGFSVKVVTE